MAEPYEEMIDGEWVLRIPPRPSHEAICLSLHRLIAGAISTLSSTRLLEMRSQVILTEKNRLRPDLCLVTVATEKPWLAAEVINPEDHNNDTVLKKDVYESLRIPRLWIIDPRYENVEIYHATHQGLSLRDTLMVKEFLSDPLLPGLSLSIREIFAAPDSPMGSAPRDF